MPPQRSVWNGFNSIVVRLKAKQLVSDFIHRRSFNSIVVRLKEGMLMSGYSAKQVFQFHSGSIKSVGNVPKEQIIDKVSIP